MADASAGDDQMYEILDRVRLGDFIRTHGGLDMELKENASNLSGGQRQRLSLARALLHDTPVYTFDEASSNIDVESETIILDQIHKLKGSKTILLITHRLASAENADNIYVLENGEIKENGRHQELLDKHGLYETMWNAQQSVLDFMKGGE